VNLLSLNPLQPEQLPDVVALDQQCFGGLWTLEGYQRELTSPNSYLLGLKVPVNFQHTMLSFPIETSGLIGIGCFWAIVAEAHITLLGIHSDYRCQGLGQLVLLALLTEAVHWGLERATLEVRASNQIAIAIYQKFGFKIAGNRKKYYSNPPEDALILWRGGLQTEEFSRALTVGFAQQREQLQSHNWQLQPPKNLKR
jgi:ribosomal-protein-alanine N-acetyltransferase